MNRVAAGLDYSLTGGDHPLVLMADALLDVYNFREPTFNTSRITSFDVGLRYGFNPNLYGSLGWMTYNDSENDARGSGLFAGLQWMSEGNTCEVCEPANVAEAGTEAVPLAAPSTPEQTTTLDPGTAAPATLPAPPPAPVESAPVEVPPVAKESAPAPVPASVPPPATGPPPAPAPAEDNLVLPAGRAEGPVRNRVVSSLQQEFTEAPEDGASNDSDVPMDDYDPRSWEEQASDEPGNAAVDEGVDVPELQLFPESVQADAKSVRPPLRRNSTGAKSTSSTKEKAIPADDQSVVDVEIVTDAPDET
jgi:hypothetical protein